VVVVATVVAMVVVVVVAVAGLAETVVLTGAFVGAAALKAPEDPYKPSASLFEVSGTGTSRLRAAPRAMSEPARG
jgi:3-deoxy-D-arabino-heptulosonate 7-phosphate (DAHP) synthase